MRKSQKEERIGEIIKAKTERVRLLQDGEIQMI